MDESFSKLIQCGRWRSKEINSQPAATKMKILKQKNPFESKKELKKTVLPLKQQLELVPVSQQNDSIQTFIEVPDKPRKRFIGALEIASSDKYEHKGLSALNSDEQNQKKRKISDLKDTKIEDLKGYNENTSSFDIATLFERMVVKDAVSNSIPITQNEVIYFTYIELCAKIYAINSEDIFQIELQIGDDSQESSVKAIYFPEDYDHEDIEKDVWIRFIGRLRMNQMKEKYFQIFYMKKVMDDEELQRAQDLRKKTYELLKFQRES